MAAKLTVSLVALSALGLAACTNPDGTTNNTGTGALVGAGVGAVAGRIIGGGNTKGTVLGAAVGAAVGGGIGASLDAQQKALQQDLSGTGARIINTGDRLIVSLPEAITFETNSANVRSSLRPSIRAIAANLQQYPNSRVQVLGHTDNTGTQAYNQQLSISRAQAVRRILVNNGISANRVTAQGLGESSPIATNATAAGRQANRRVEIVIIPN
jgi:outer membrane protein OmpA-like peptidoglycan-associated protein